MYRGQLAGTLAALGRHDEALETHQLVLQDALDMAPNDDSAVLAVCRYFLAEHLLRMNEPNGALRALLPSLRTENSDPALRALEALARWRLGEREHARTAAALALKFARSPKQAEGFR